MMFVLGILCTLLVGYAWKKKNFNLPQCLLLILALLLLVFAIDNYIALGRELEPTAQKFVLLSLGLPGIAIMALAFYLPKLRRKPA